MGSVVAVGRSSSEFDQRDIKTSRLFRRLKLTQLIVHPLANGHSHPHVRDWTCPVIWRSGDLAITLTVKLFMIVVIRAHF